MDELTFVGTATVLLRLGSFTVLTDPNFLHRGQRAYLGKGLWSRRLTEPSLQPDELPELDLVLLSHLHGDHFDRIARRQLSRSQPVVTTPHAARRLSRWGFACEALSPWESTTLVKGEESLLVRAVPGVHARGVLQPLLPPVMGSMLEHRVGGRVRRIYVSGDTLMGAHVEEIARRHPDVDLALVHLGGTRVLFHTVTMDAAQGVEFVRRVAPRQTVPIHYDDYRVFRSPLSDFIDLAAATAPQTRIRVVRRGETMILPDAGA